MWCPASVMAGIMSVDMAASMEPAGAVAAAAAAAAAAVAAWWWAAAAAAAADAEAAVLAGLGRGW